MVIVVKPVKYRKVIVFNMSQKKIQKHIEIVRSSASRLSSMGKKSSEAAHTLLKAHYETVGISVVNTLDQLEQLVAMQPDLVFVGSKYVPGKEEGTRVWISDYLDQNGITHTGSPVSAIRLEQNKPLAKQRVLNANLKSSQYVVLKSGEKFDDEGSALRFPMFIKPVNMGAGQGVDAKSVVHNLDELHAKADSLAVRYGVDALIEEFLPGREYSVAVLKREDSDELLAMPLELVPGPNADGHRILSHELKAAPLETPVFPVTDPVVRASLIDLATNAFIALGARDYGRIDIRMDAAGVPHFLEANLIPCLIEGSGNFPKACAMNIGMDYETMMLHIVRLAFARTADANELTGITDARYSVAIPVLV
jgi:D-alanine-D-alanine ligase